MTTNNSTSCSSHADAFHSTRTDDDTTMNSDDHPSANSSQPCDQSSMSVSQTREQERETPRETHQQQEPQDEHKADFDTPFIDTRYSTLIGTGNEGDQENADIEGDESEHLLHQTPNHRHQYQGFSYGDSQGRRQRFVLDPRETLLSFDDDDETPLKHRTELVSWEEITNWRNSQDRAPPKPKMLSHGNDEENNSSYGFGDSSSNNGVNIEKGTGNSEEGTTAQEASAIRPNEKVASDQQRNGSSELCNCTDKLFAEVPVKSSESKEHSKLGGQENHSQNVREAGSKQFWTNSDGVSLDRSSSESNLRDTGTSGKALKYTSQIEEKEIEDACSVSFSLQGLYNFFVSELSWGTTRKSAVAGNEHISNMLKIPVYFERFIAMAWLISLDLFLHNLTLLPLRFIYSVGSICSSMLNPMSKRPLRRAVVYDVVRGLTIVLACYVLSYVQISRVYHYIRGEAIIKLYVIFNILEIFDKLLASFGQDVLDGLYRSTVQHSNYLVGLQWLHEPWRMASVGMHIVIAALYVVLHSLLQFLQIVCINVAINSHGHALFTLLISNNFMELKSSVFKRFAPENLFQVSASDAVERFQIALFLMLIILQDVSSLGSLWAMVPTAAGIWLSECFIDWTKHCFVAKFNRMHSNVYNKYITLLALDTINTRKTLNSCLDPTHRRGRRLGLATLPLTCVLVRLLSIKLYSSRVEVLSYSGILWIVMGFLLLLVVKMALSLLLLQLSAWWLQNGYDDPCGTVSEKRKDGVSSSNDRNSYVQDVDPATLLTGGDGLQGDTSDTVHRISNVSRYTLHGNRVPL